MAQQEEKLKADIEAAEDKLRDNFEEIQNRVKTALDWRIWYRNNTALAIGGAVAGGLLVSLLISRKPSLESKFSSSDEVYPPAEPNGQPKSRSRFHNVLDNTMAAVVGVASDQFRDFMARALPGFNEHYHEAERRR